MHSAAATGANRSRPSKVAPRSGGAGSRASSTTWVTGASPAASAAATRSPLSGPTKKRVPPAGRRHLEADAPARRADPGVDHAEHDAAAEVRHGPHQRVAPGPHVEGRDVVGEVDDRRAGGTAAITAWTTPTNSSWLPKSERKKTVRTGSLATARPSALQVA